MYIIYMYLQIKANKTIRVPISCKDIAILIEKMGVERLICVDLHSE